MKKAEIISWAVGSLAGDADRWEFEEYHATHLDGVRVWMANGPDGLDIRHRDVMLVDHNMLFGNLVPWRWRLYRAVKAASRRRAMGRTTSVTNDALAEYRRMVLHDLHHVERDFAEHLEKRQLEQDRRTFGEFMASRAKAGGTDA